MNTDRWKVRLSGWKKTKDTEQSSLTRVKSLCLKCVQQQKIYT